MPLLAWALTGDSRKTELVAPFVQPAQVKGYARFAVIHADYPAAIEHEEDSIVDGLLLLPQTKSQRRKLDDFEGEIYTVTPVTVTTTDSQGQAKNVEADMYVWGGDMDCVSKDPWHLEDFLRDRLDDWLDLFSGMELVGDDE